MTAQDPLLTLGEARRAGASMRRLRREQGLRQRDLAVMLGTTQDWVSVRETGAVRMRRGGAEKVAAALGTDFEGLLAAGAAPGPGETR